MQDSELKMKYYECKVSAEMVNEYGNKVVKRFSYLVLTDSCTRAEQLVKAEYENRDALVSVTDVVCRKFDELIADFSAGTDLKFYKVAYTVTALNRGGREVDKKRTALVTAEKLHDATESLLVFFLNSMDVPVLTSVTETPIIEFIKDTGE